MITAGLASVLLTLATTGVQAADILRTPETQAALDFDFTPADEQLLEAVQYGAFQYFWNEVGDPCPIAKDRLLGPVSSIAAVGFQLAALPIGVERGWVTREKGEERAAAILRCLIARDDNKTHGVYQHFVDLNTGGIQREGYELVASTVDHALFMAGGLVAASYFRGEVAQQVQQIVSATEWDRFAVGPEGYLSMGWRLKSGDEPQGPGEFTDHHWWSAADEERLIYFLAAGHPDSAHRVAPEMYYRLQRPVKRWRDGPPFVVSWPGALFTYFFSHCYIDYRSLQADNPQWFGIDAPRVDWFENSRRATLTQRQRTIELADEYQTFAPDRWGQSACDGPTGYLVPHVRPNIYDRDILHDGTLAPYAAGAAIMFTPVESLAALRAFRALQDEEGEPLLWRDPAAGGYGFVDAFNLRDPWVSRDYIGIDQGPMLLAIENARTGLIWRLFMAHPVAREAIRQLRFEPRPTRESPQMEERATPGRRSGR